jgi:hypothetical protein
MNNKLTLDDIADLRAYERERESFRASVIEQKKRRRIGVGPAVSLVFENRDTIRFQVQEMARAERMLSDHQIQAELDIYNPLIPAPGQLSATLFVELTDQEQMRYWLPRLVGIERSVEFRLAGGVVVSGLVDASHDAQLTREEVTASVHYVYFQFTDDEVELFAASPVSLAIDLPSYQESTELSDESKQTLLEDLRGSLDE